MTLKGHAEYTTKSGRGKRRVTVWVDCELLDDLNENIKESGMSASGYMTWLIREHNKHIKLKGDLMAGLQEKVQQALVTELARAEVEKQTSESVGKKAPKKG